MNDDIELPPIEQAPLLAYDTRAIQDFARAAVLADRQKREKPERRVHSQAIAPFGTRQYVVILKWDDKRAWLDSGKSRALAGKVRLIADCPALPDYDAAALRRAADALDGGECS